MAVVAFSDRGSSALQFALRYPERCAALLVISAPNLFLLVWFLVSLLEFAETYVWPSQRVLTIKACGC